MPYTAEGDMTRERASDLALITIFYSFSMTMTITKK